MRPNICETVLWFTVRFFFQVSLLAWDACGGRAYALRVLHCSLSVVRVHWARRTSIRNSEPLVSELSSCRGEVRERGGDPRGSHRHPRSIRAGAVFGVGWWVLLINAVEMKNFVALRFSSRKRCCYSTRDLIGDLFYGPIAMVSLVPGMLL